MLCVTWDDILWSAITLGRPDPSHVFKYGMSSIYEAFFRFYLVKMALDSSGNTLYRSKAVNYLDPTEKGMVNYFIGMIFCKLFSSKLLDTPWLMHLDVWRRHLNIEISGRSRPDLVGKNSITGEWSVFESKGRASPPGQQVKKDAKEQAMRVAHVSGSSCSLRVAAITYYVGDEVNFYWCDPPSRDDRGDQIELPPVDDLWQYYYGLVAEIIAPSVRSEHAWRIDGETRHWHVSIEQWDLEVVVHRSVADQLRRRDWEQARAVALGAAEELEREGFHADGVRVRAGDSWYQAGGDDTISARGE